MRSRYTAYAIGAIEYLEESIHPAYREGVDRDSTKTWSENADWQGLDILATEAGGPDDQKGVVEFRARFSIKGGPGAPRTRHLRAEGRPLVLRGRRTRPAEARHPRGAPRRSQRPLPLRKREKIQEMLRKSRLARCGAADRAPEGRDNMDEIRSPGDGVVTRDYDVCCSGERPPRAGHPRRPPGCGASHRAGRGSRQDP